jgi:DNA-binding NarL/FixJ family response regulator
MYETIRRKRIAIMQESTNSELDVAAMVMLLDCGMSLKDIAECFKLDVKTVERLIVEHRRSPGSKQALE